MFVIKYKSKTLKLNVEDGATINFNVKKNQAKHLTVEIEDSDEDNEEQEIGYDIEQDRLTHELLESYETTETLKKLLNKMSYNHRKPVSKISEFNNFSDDCLDSDDDEEIRRLVKKVTKKYEDSSDESEQDSDRDSDECRKPRKSKKTNKKPNYIVTGKITMDNDDDEDKMTKSERLTQYKNNDFKGIFCRR